MKYLLFVGLLVLGAVGLEAQGHALLFDGLDDKVTIPDRYADLDLGTNITLEAWVKPDSAGEWLPVIQGEHSQGLAWTIVLEWDSWFCSISVPGTDSAYSGSGAITPAEWHHLACTYDGSTIRIYQDGVPIGSKVHDNGGPASDVDQLVLGAWDNFGYYLPGTVDEVLVWSEVRSPGEIALDYQYCVNGTEANLMGFWRINEGGGQMVIDSSGGENHGWCGSDSSPETSDPVWVISDAPLVCIFTDGFESGDTSAWSNSVP